MLLSTPAIIGRLILAAVFTALGEFCIFGFIASLEPGSPLAFQIAYAGLAILFLGAAIFLALSPLTLRRAARRLGLVGVSVGAAAAFLLVVFLARAGKGGETSTYLGIGYGLLVMPIGAIIGGAVGALVGHRGASALRRTEK